MRFRNLKAKALLLLEWCLWIAIIAWFVVGCKGWFK